MPLDKAALFSQWRRIVLALAALFALIAAILAQQALDKDIFSVTVTLSAQGIEQLANKTETAMTSIAHEAASAVTSLGGKAESAATSYASKAKTKIESAKTKLESGVDDLTAEIGNLLLAQATSSASLFAFSTSTDAFLLPTAAPVVQARWNPFGDDDGSSSSSRSNNSDDDDDDDDDSTSFTLSIKPHTKVDLGKLGDIPILGDLLTFIVDIVINISPLGVILLLHLLVIIFLWIYFVRLLFRIASSSPTSTRTKGQSNTWSIAYKLISMMPCIKGPEMVFKIVTFLFVPILLAAVVAFSYVAYWIDRKIWHAVHGENYDSFLDLVTLDFVAGPAPGYVKAAMILAYMSIVIDLSESMVSSWIGLKQLKERAWQPQDASHKFELHPSAFAANHKEQA